MLYWLSMPISQLAIKDFLFIFGEGILVLAIIGVLLFGSVWE